MTFSRKTALAAAIAALGLAPAAHAQTTGTDPCPATVLGSDPTGDARLYGAIPASTNSDISEISIRTADRKTFVTFTIPQLDKTVPQTSTGLAWYFEYTYNGATLFVDATLNPDGSVVFETGTDGQSYTPTGPTSGTFTESKDGKPGQISIQLPGLTSATKSYELTTTRGIAYQAIGVSNPSVGSFAFLPAADTVATDEHVTKPCSTTAAPAPAAGSGTTSANKQRRLARRARARR
jgi:hypothetical protein